MQVLYQSRRDEQNNLKRQDTFSLISDADLMGRQHYNENTLGQDDGLRPWRKLQQVLRKHF